ncbi:MAG TPA: hemolysin family protein [Verrucomicrobiae bacterium]|nr:hemolysin family protein [Verrucomicrobiae bacterium]
MLTITLILELLALGVLLILSAFFSGTEIALFSLSRLQLRHLRLEHPVQGQIVSELLDQPHRLLSTILFGNTVVNVAAAILGYSVLQTLVPGRAETFAVPVMTLLILLCGEIVPKTLVIGSAEFFALYLARPTQWTMASTSLLRRAAEALSAMLVRGIERWPFFALHKVRSGAPTEDEYRTLLTVGERAGIVRKEERHMVNKILALEKMPVKEIMTPRVDMQCVDDSLSPPEMAEVLRRIKHRRVPIIHETPDTVEGILNVKDFLVDPARDLDEVVELPNFVPETMPVAKLLKTFRKQEHPVAIVVDEYGGTQGMVTLEDILEEIVGEIEDEFDKSEIMVQKLDGQRYLINGKARLELVNEQCGLALHAPDVETIAGWVIAQLGALPKEGEQVRVDNVCATARKVVKNRVGEVVLEVALPAPGGDEG